MDNARWQVFTRAVVLVGVFYAVVGVVFAWPANHVRVWRLSAWLVSAAAYAGHIGYEHFGMRNAPRQAALHVAFAAALGAFGLALAATIHSLLVVSITQHRRLLLVALVIWPIVTCLPAFLVGLTVNEMLARLAWKSRAQQ